MKSALIGSSGYQTKKKVAWITVPAFISTDRFIVPEIAKHYQVDWYLISKSNEKIDFIDDITSLTESEGFSFSIIRINYRNSSVRTIKEYVHFLNEIKRKNYDLVYNAMIGIPYYMPILKIIIGNNNVLVAIHNVHVPKGGSMYLPSLIYTNYTIKSFKYFQTFSASQKNILLKIAPNKYCDNVNFVLIDYGKPSVGRKEDIITFLNFGIIREYKRIDVLIQAAEKAYDATNKEFRVIIAGDCDKWEKYQNIIKYPHLFDLRIRRIEDEEIPNLFAESHYFVAPYQDIAQSGSAIIAINYNIPVIASRLEAFEDYIEDMKTGFLINPADIDDLTKVFIYILNNHNQFYKQMSKNIADEKQEKFSAEAVVKLYKKNFDKVLSES